MLALRFAAVVALTALLALFVNELLTTAGSHVREAVRTATTTR